MHNRPLSQMPGLPVLLTMTMAVVGCGDSGPSRVKVTGVITYNGKPLEGAAVMFLPDPSNPVGRPAEDETGPEGNYKAMTDGRSGVIPGKYHIVVSKAPTTPVVTGEAFKEDPFMAQMTIGTSAKKGATDAIEASYDREVSADGSVFDLDVKGRSAPGK